MSENRKVYFENLDGLRFICFLLVFLHHSFHTEILTILHSEIHIFLKRVVFTNGNLGVNFFFVLSGFLITHLLIQEKTSSTIHIQNFWIRRILRIWPLYFFCVIFGFFISPSIKLLMGIPSTESATFIRYLTFTNNFELIEKGLPDASVLGVLWSIAIEEQFYFVWPIILSIIPIRKYWLVFIVILLLSTLFRYINLNYIVHEYHTLSCIGDMTIGGIGAWLIYQCGSNKIANLPRFLIILLYLATVIIFIYRKEFYAINMFTAIFERPMIAFLFLMIILEQNYAKNSLFKLGKFKYISYLGTISYGLYCLHFIGILIVLKLTKMLEINDQIWQVVILETLLSVFLTIVLAHLSYQYFERFFLRLKNKYT